MNWLTRVMVPSFVSYGGKLIPVHLGDNMHLILTQMCLAV